MRDLPTSTKILIFSMFFVSLCLGIFFISNSRTVRDSITISELSDMKIENPEKVFKKYQSIKDENSAMEYLKNTIAESNNTLSKEESKLFKDNVLLEPINTLHYSETYLFIKYNKLTISDDDYLVIKEYINNKKAFPVKIIYETMDMSSLSGKFLYFDLTRTDENKDQKLESIKVPNAFLVIDGELKESYKDYKDMALQ